MSEVLFATYDGQLYSVSLDNFSESLKFRKKENEDEINLMEDIDNAWIVHGLLVLFL
jgi:hypothetical protein